MESDLRDLTVEDWRQIVDDANSSDLTKREWCARAGIAEKTLYYWQRKFREEDTQQQTEEAASVDTQAEESTFVELPLEVTCGGTLPSAANVLPPEGPAQPIPAKAHKPCEVKAGISFVPEMAIQTGDFQLFIGGNISEKALRVAMEVLRHA